MSMLVKRDVVTDMTRRKFFEVFCASAVFAGFSFSPIALANDQIPQTMIFDRATKKWVVYSPDIAMRIYQQMGRVPEEFRRQKVAFRGNETAGTVIIDSDRHFLFVTDGKGSAVRYGIGVGRDGFGWAGIVKVGRKTEWPKWTPPAEMIARDPAAARWAAGMPGGEDNPLGARALYLYESGRDTIYRIHGTNEPWSIGLDVSSGCIRLKNEDVADLYSRVPVGAKVIVLSQDARKFEGAL